MCGVDVCVQSDEEIFRNEYGLGYHAYILVYSIASARSLEVLKACAISRLGLCVDHGRFLDSCEAPNDRGFRVWCVGCGLGVLFSR